MAVGRKIDEGAPLSVLVGSRCGEMPVGHFQHFVAHRAAAADVSRHQFAGGGECAAVVGGGHRHGVPFGDRRALLVKQCDTAVRHREEYRVPVGQAVIFRQAAAFTPYAVRRTPRTVDAYILLAFFCAFKPDGKNTAVGKGQQMAGVAVAPGEIGGQNVFMADDTHEPNLQYKCYIYFNTDSARRQGFICKLAKSMLFYYREVLK